MEERAYKRKRVSMFVIPKGRRKFIYGGRMELVESKKRSECGGGRVKGSEVEREIAGRKRGKLKLMVCFPSGHGITFLRDLCNTVHTL